MTSPTLAAPEALALGAAVVLPALGVLWKGASLRGDLFSKWADRVDIAEAGLSERAVNLLRTLQAETEALLGHNETAGFDPSVAFADPAPLTRTTRRFDRTIRARKSLKRQFRLVVAVGAIAPILAIPYLLGCLASLTYYAGVHGVEWLAPAGIWAVGGSLGIGAALVGAYSYLNWRLTSAEIMSRPRGDRHD